MAATRWARDTHARGAASSWSRTVTLRSPRPLNALLHSPPRAIGGPLRDGRVRLRLAAGTARRAIARGRHPGLDHGAVLYDLRRAALAHALTPDGWKRRISAHAVRRAASNLRCVGSVHAQCATLLRASDAPCPPLPNALRAPRSVTASPPSSARRERRSSRPRPPSYELS